MSQHAREYGFIELTSLPALLPVLLAVTAALSLFEAALALGFALGAAGALFGSYLTLLHLRQLFERAPTSSEGQFKRGAFSGTLASVALMVGVLALGALVPWLDFFATAAGLLAAKLLIGLTPVLRRRHGGDR